jgi:plastocyanin
MSAHRPSRTRPLLVASTFVLTLVFGVAACGSEREGEDAAERGRRGAASVEIVNFIFKPQSLTVEAGTTVTWTNRDGFAHTVDSEDDSFVSENLNQGDSFRHTFETAGTFPYICGIHNSMTGTVTVT